MATLRCRKCKRMFEFSTVGQLCPTCMSIEEKRFQRVRQFIKDNPGLSVTDISFETKVPASKILNYIKEERLEVISGEGFLKCKNCGAEITTGMFCSSCKKATIQKMEDKKEYGETKTVTENAKGTIGSAGAMKNHNDI